MTVSFITIKIGQEYTRDDLAKLWGYSGFQALARGVVTPKETNKIILFITKEKQASQEQYRDELKGNMLYWEGPTDHGAEDRMINSTHSRDEIHVFYRDRHHSSFIYEGKYAVVEHLRYANKPSRFVFKKLE